MINLEVKNKWELLAIHKLISSVKRSDDPDLPEALFSPYIANFAEQVASKLIEVENKEGNIEAAKRWEKCLIADSESAIVPLFLKQINGADWWENLDDEGKRKHILMFFSPSIPTKELLEKLTAL